MINLTELVKFDFHLFSFEIIFLNLNYFSIGFFQLNFIYLLQDQQIMKKSILLELARVLE